MVKDKNFDNEQLRTQFGYSSDDSPTDMSLEKQTADEKLLYVKVRTRSDIPSDVDYDDQTGKKIVYIVEDED